MKPMFPWSEVLNLTKHARIDDPMEAWDFMLLAKLVRAIDEVLQISKPSNGVIDQAVYRLIRAILNKAGIDPDK